MGTAPHHVRRQRVVVRAPSERVAFSIRSEIRNAIDTVVLPALDRALSSIVSEDEVVRLPSLSISVRVGPHESITEAIIREIAASLPARVADAMADAGMSGATRESVGRNRRRALLEYLATGRCKLVAEVPAGASGGHPLRMEAAALASDDRALKAALDGPMRSSESAAARFMHLLGDGERRAFVLRLGIAGKAQQETDARTSILEGLTLLVERASLPVSTLFRVQVLALVCWASPLDSERQKAVGHLLQMCAEHLRSSNDSLLRQTIDSVATIISIASSEHSNQSRCDPELRREDAVYTERRLLQVAAAPNVEDLRNARSASGVFVAEDAGLVILHPFLPQFFETVGVCARDAHSIPDRTVATAASLLAYLATGDAEPCEFAMTVAKILIGLEPGNAVLPVGGPIAPELRAEADRVLSAVRTHWASLRGTSDDGLRVSFLRRRGLVERSADGWSLRVEPVTVDVLVSQLPWSISIVKYPWMKQLLWTDWPSP